MIILILFFAVGGWNGNRGGNGGPNTVIIPNNENNGYNACCTPATQQGMTDAFNFNSLNNSIRGAQNGLCQGFYAMSGELANIGSQIQANSYNSEINAMQNNFALQNAVNSGVNGIQQSLNCGFDNIQSAIANTNYNMKDCCCETRESIMQSNFNNQSAFNNIQSQMQSGFCGVQNGQEKLNYAIAQAACELKTNADANTDRIINHMVQSEMDNLRTQLQSANFQLSQLSQTSNIINALQPTPQPSYLVTSPYQSIPLGGVFPTNGNSCGCC